MPPTEPSPKLPRLPGAVIALGLTSFFTDVGTEMIFPLLPAFVASLGAAPAFLGLVEGLANATASLLKLVIGYVSEGRSKKPFVVIGYAIASVARPLVALASAPWHVLAMRVSDRVGKGLRSTPRDALIANSVAKEQAGRAFGFHTAMDHAGAVVGPLIATLLLSLGWQVRSVFWWSLVPGALAFLTVLTLREPPLESAAPRAQVGSRPAGAGSSDAATQDPRAPLPRSLRHYLLILAVFSLGNSSDAFLLLRARDLGVQVVSIPVLWAVFHVAKVVSSHFGGTWADRIERPKLIVSGWGVYALTYLGFGSAQQPWQAWALFVVYGAYYGLTEPAEKAMVRDLAPTSARGRAYGAYNFIIGVAALPAGVLTGWLWQAWSPQVALGTGAALAFAAAIALLVWSRRPSVPQANSAF